MEKSTFTPQYAILRERLLALRKASGLTQRELAAKLGREHNLIFRLERAERRLDLIEWVWVCKALGVPPAKTVYKIMLELEALERQGNPSRSHPRQQRPSR